MDFLYIFLACYMKLQRVTSVLQENFCKIGKQQAQTAHNRPQEDKKSTQQGTQTQESTANKATATPARCNTLYFLSKVPCVRAVPSLNSPHLRNISIRRHRLRRCRAVLWNFFFNADMDILPFLFIPCKIDVHKYNGFSVLLFRFNVH